MKNNMPQIIHMPTLFGIEAITRQELEDLGFDREQIVLSDGLVTLLLNEKNLEKMDLAETVAMLNYSLRTCERVLLQVAEFDAYTFDELYDQSNKLPWEDWLDLGYAFDIIGYSRKSQLFGVPSMQGIIKKAIIDRLSKHSKEKRDFLNHKGTWLENRDLGVNRLQFANVEDHLTLSLDTSGDGLHKRGYRRLTHSAPIRETLAAAILYLAHFKRNCIRFDEQLWDPVCGVGSFIIEAALMLTDTAPGLRRHFSGEKMKLIGKAAFDRVREQLKQKSLLYYHDRNPEKIDQLQALKGLLFGSDISSEYVKQARKNAAYAGVDMIVNFKSFDLIKISEQKALPFAEQLKAERILLVANPPYGERMGDFEDVKRLHRALSDICFNFNRGEVTLDPRYRISIITGDKYFEKAIQKKADKRRKLYNGMIECTLFQYFRH